MLHQLSKQIVKPLLHKEQRLIIKFFKMICVCYVDQDLLEILMVFVFK